MKRLLILFLAGAIALSACASAPVSTGTPAAPAAITVTDALGRNVTLAAPPTRIVINGRALFMVVDAVYLFPEAASRIAALGNSGQTTNDFISLFDPQYPSKVTLQQDAGAEQMAAAQPDLVILKSSLAETTGKALEALKIPVVYVDFETPAQYQRDLLTLGKVFQNEARAQQVAGYFQKKVNEIQTALQGAAARPRVLLLYYSDKDGAVAFNVPPMEWMQTQIVQMAGGEPVWGSANPAKGWTKVTLEQVAAWDADQIFIIAYTKNPSEVVAELKANPQWQGLRAVQQKRLYAFPGDFYSWDQPDTRWVLGLSWLAARLYPDRFPRFDVVEEARQFYQTLYGVDAQRFEGKIRPLFKGDLP